MVAALLDLQKGAAFALEAVDEVRRGFDRIGERGVLWQIALRQQLRLIVEYAVDFGQRGIAFRRQMGGTTRYDNSRLGVLSARAADCLACLPLGLGSNRASIDDNRTGQPGGGRGATNDL